eukprot:s308_g10.t1
MTSSPVAKVKVSKKEQPKEEAKAKGSKESKGGKLKAKKTSEVEFSELADEVDEEAWNKPKKVSKKVKVKSEQPAVPAVSKLKAKKASEPSDPAVGKKKRRNEIKEASVETVDTIPAKKKLSKKAPKQEEQKDPDATQDGLPRNRVMLNIYDVSRRETVRVMNAVLAHWLAPVRDLVQLVCGGLDEDLVIEITAFVPLDSRAAAQRLQRATPEECGAILHAPWDCAAGEQ